MLVSTVHKFIFHHVPKTGGSSMTAALAPLLDNPRPFHGECHGWQSRHHTGGIHVPVSQTKNPNGFVEWGFVRNPFDIVASLWSRAHEGSSTPDGRALPPRWQPGEMPFDRFVEEAVLDPQGWKKFRYVHLRLSQTQYTKPPTGSDRQVYLFKFEDLPHSWKAAMEFIEVVDPPELPRLNACKDRKAYREIYPNDRCIDIVANRYRDDLERFSYVF